MKTSLISVAVMLGVSSAFSGTSILTTRLEDPKAVYLAAPEFNVRGDGKTDDSAAIQAAVDKAEKNADGGVRRMDITG
jgi:polygalacturonase